MSDLRADHPDILTVQDLERDTVGVADRRFTSPEATAANALSQRLVAETPADD